jgi:DNA-binding transcriptional MerR regulator
VKTVAALTGIPRATLVAWERRHGILEPRRSAGGYRVYTDDDVALLQRLKSMTDGGLAISEAVRVLAARPAAAPVPAPTELTPDVETLHDALVRFDRAAADACLARSPLGFEAAITSLYMPLLRRVGDEWAAGRLGVAQEHFASDYCRERLLQAFQAVGAGPADGVPVVCAGLPGERHELGLLAVAARLALRGFRVTWLGADLPVAALVAHLQSFRPRLACVSAMRVEASSDLEAVSAEIRAGTPPDVILAVGGPAAGGLTSREGLWYCADVDDLLRRWSAHVAESTVSQARIARTRAAT